VDSIWIVFCFWVKNQAETRKPELINAASELPCVASPYIGIYMYIYTTYL